VTEREKLIGKSCEVQVICDSVSQFSGIRLTTLQLRYWRPIHAELMTHRVFSRNARSSRAVPVATLLKEAIYIPQFEKNQPGMQSTQTFTMPEQAALAKIWSDFAEQTRAFCHGLMEIGVHKQWANRPLEWFGWIDVLVTSTDWANWFALRNHPDAAPEIHELAHLMDQAMQPSFPKVLGYDEWHLPYITSEEQANIGRYLDLSDAKVLSAARCARLSYKPFDGETNPERERERYQKLVGSAPVHASPTEHQATPDYIQEIDLGKGQEIKVWARGKDHGNFTGWIQHRKEIQDEAIMDFHNQ
jgi:hypothetical protein